MTTSTPVQPPVLIPESPAGRRLPRWRIIMAIVRKDMLDITTNPTTLVMIGLPLVMLFLFQLLLAEQDSAETLTVVLYDPSNSQLSAVLEDISGVSLQPAASAESLYETYQDAPVAILAPADFDALLRSGSQPELTVFLNPGLASSGDIARFQQVFQERLWSLAEVEAPVQLAWEKVESGRAAGRDRELSSFLVTILVLTSLMMIGSLVSYLLVQEKDTSTLRILLLSPANHLDVLIGKGVTGFLYAVLVASLVIIGSGQAGNAWFVGWLSVPLGALFMVACGLLIGLVFQSKEQCNSWGSLIMLLLLTPAWLLAVESPEGWLGLATRLLPTYYLAHAFFDSVAGVASPAESGLNLAVVVGSTLLVWVLVVWRARGSLA